MDKGLRKTIFGLLIIAVVILAAGFTFFNTVFNGHYFAFFPVLVLFFLLVNAGFFVLFFRALRNSHNQFIRTFMVSTGIKLVLYMVLTLVYVVTSPGTAIAFAITLSAVYISFTVYDLWIMLSVMKRQKENSAVSGHLSN